MARGYSQGMRFCTKKGLNFPSKTNGSSKFLTLSQYQQSLVSAGTTEFLSLLAVLFGGGMIGAWLMHKIKFPTIIGFILVGIIVGPYGLSIIEDTELINLLAEFGIIILLFVVGLEFSIHKLKRVGLNGIIIGTVQLGIVFFLGYVVAVALGWSHL